MLGQFIYQKMEYFAERNAISWNNKIITYAELKKNAVAVANYLLSTGSDEMVCGIYFSHGLWGIVAIIGCLFAGITYVPIDQDEVKENIEYILNNSGVGIIISDKTGVDRLTDKHLSSKDSICIADVEEIVSSYSTPTDLMVPHENASAVYHLYTSGSTGRPKAVTQTGKSILHFADTYARTINLSCDDKMTLFSSFGHDAAVIDIYSCLLTGACLYPNDLRKPKNMLTLPMWLHRNQISIWHSVPSFYRKFFGSYWDRCRGHSVRVIVLGGEMLRKSDYPIFEKCKGVNGTRLYNLYGQTESSFSSGNWVESEEDCEYFGMPIFNTSIITKEKSGSILILGEPLSNSEIVQLQSPTVNLAEGEIVVISSYVAKQYIGEPALSSKVFFTLGGGKNIYKTGDYIESTVNGGFKFCGRKDRQCKINGFRVELNIIEDKLLELQGVEDCTVFAKEINGQNRLLGALQTKKNLNVQEVNTFLSGRVPSYMLLHSVKCFENLPITLTGKINTSKIFF